MACASSFRDKNLLYHIHWGEPRLEDMMKSFERTDFEGDLFDMWILEAGPSAEHCLLLSR